MSDPFEGGYLTVNVRARVWSTGRRGYRTWHYAVYSTAGKIVAYDNTGSFAPILRTALMYVEVIGGLERSGHVLDAYPHAPVPPPRKVRVPPPPRPPRHYDFPLAA